MESTHFARYQTARRATQVVTIFLTVVLMIFVVFPFFWMISASIRPDKFTISNKLYILPPQLTLDHYVGDRNSSRGSFSRCR